MSFADEVVKQGRGVVWKLDISLDQFATISYRYSSLAGIDSSHDYDPRLLAIGNITRGLGLDHLVQAGSMEVVFANDDELADWMVDQSTGVDMLRARANLYVGVYDPTLDASAIPGSIQWKALGVFMFSEFPRRTQDRIVATLMDDSASFLNEVVVLPTLGDWESADSSSSTNPFAGIASGLWDRNATGQLAFGDDWVLAQRGTIKPVDSGAYAGKVPFIVCITANLDPVTSHDVTEVLVEIPSDVQLSGSVEEFLPNSYTSKATGTSVTVWEAVKSATVTKDGKSFQYLFLMLDAEAFASWYADLYGISPQVAALPGFTEALLEHRLTKLWVRGYPLSAVTSKNFAVQTPSDIIRDLVSYYSKGSASDLDIESLDRLTDNLDYLAAGVIAAPASDISADPLSDTKLADHLSDIAASFDFDVFITWSGKLGVVARNYADVHFLASLPAIDETRIADVEDGVPSREQRGAPFNRIIVRDHKQGPAWAGSFFPTTAYDDPQNTQRNTAWGRVLSRTLSAKWRRVLGDLLGSNPWYMRTVSSAVVRPRIRFTTDFEALLLELGSYFKLTWTRNHGDPYSATVFQVESLTIHPNSNTVTVEALWADDVATERPFILDQESFLTVATGSAARTVTLQDGSEFPVFSSGDLNVDGVQVGDQLILKDSTEASTSFKRFKALRIVEVLSGTTMEVDDPLDNHDYGTGGGSLAVASWEIRRSHVTYPTVASDPSNYPDGADHYGRVASSDSSGTYSEAGTGGFTAAHQLLDG